MFESPPKQPLILPERNVANPDVQAANAYASSVNWYPKSDADWHPGKPTVGQLAFGAVFFLVLAGLALYWAEGESEMGNRIFLRIVAGLLLVLATWRTAMGVRLARDERRRRAVRGL